MVLVNGKKLSENNTNQAITAGWNYDAANQQLQIHTGLGNQENQIQIQVQY